MTSKCDDFCKNCDYVGYYNNNGHHEHRYRVCDHILLTGQRRGCLAGHGCTKKRVNGAPILRGYAERMDQETRAAKRKEKTTWA